MAYFRTHQNTKGEWYWLLKSKNNETVCWSEGYTSKSNAINSINWVKANAATAEIR
jgi:uncharacterized protein YegP (UPF0339 family)